MNILVACERSGVTREMFRLAGHNAYSCDLEESEIKSSYHLQGDVLDYIEQYQNHYDLAFKMLIAYPPCTNLCVSGARWFKDKKAQQEKDIKFIKDLMNVPIPKICLENPVGIISTRIRKPDQIIQPYQFGHGETKKTCLWLKNLPPLSPTWNIKYPANRVFKMPPGKERAFERSRTYIGIAFAMASQWGNGKVWN